MRDTQNALNAISIPQKLLAPHSQLYVELFSLIEQFCAQNIIHSSSRNIVFPTL
jgi:hypothetical protein